MITVNIINRTYHISVNNDMGSSFTIEHKGQQYLISAKHVIDSIKYKNGDFIVIQIYHDGKWKSLACQAYIHENKEVDIVVLKTSQVKFNKFPIKIGMHGLYLAQEVYFLGFPYGMFSEESDGEVNQKFPIPFVKKGIFSALITDNGVTSMYIDAHNNIGFSGGPVITVDKDNTVQIIGVNVSYLKHDNIINYEEQDDDGNLYDEKFEYYENSGIMEAHAIGHAIEIIEKIL
jgi:S1-C subfamily serine protease